MRYLVQVLFAAILVGCWGGGDEYPELDYTGVVFDGGRAGGGMSPEQRRAWSVPLTREASELRRIREEHQRLIASMPEDPEMTVTPGPVELQEAAIAKIVDSPEGLPAPAPVGADWFDPRVGLSFYRQSGGDWTSRRVRESHTHRNLFYYQGYPEGVVNFGDESIFQPLAQELVFEATRVLPVLGEPTLAMVDAFRRDLGWELLNAPAPVVNVWTTFVLKTGGEVHRYAVGGVMRLGVGYLGEGELRLEYLTPGEWVGPVVVERLG